MKKSKRARTLCGELPKGFHLTKLQCVKDKHHTGKCRDKNGAEWVRGAS